MKINRTKSFDREIKKLAKKHFPIQILKPCIKAIVEKDESILIKIKDHSLKGQWCGYREFHPSRLGSYGSHFDSWIVIYKIENDILVLTLVATGNHALLDK
ncbi:type II toxin-antitoxin system YafQ family toxin [Companilactobacillus nodensis]|uniref:type II toxin-antitoxin system YafQ family toxin n=1 Tax=Companilactobacillus nodensis TaxID=460870 RepID=UPI00046A744C|nr:type II toxin-antitoxin system YafQ family toxin [Companilactobacillus nodensis]